jgi:CDP-diacylglycerol--glycerol-3-phosphate 3-phosphatidyltransferase
MAKIFQVSARAGMTRVVEPIARALLDRGVTPNTVTVIGTLGVLVGALGFGARGELVAGALIVTVFALTDLLDGTMARMRGGSTPFGAFLDSSADRIADGAVFGAVAYWLATRGDHWGVAAALICLVAGSLVSYVKARAEGLGMTANVGVAERTERLIIVGIGGLLTGLGVSWALVTSLWVLAAVSIFTVGQRVRCVWRQAQAQQPSAGRPRKRRASA